jgi:hypothetical protein
MISGNPKVLKKGDVIFCSLKSVGCLAFSLRSAEDGVGRDAGAAGFCAAGVRAFIFLTTNGHEETRMTEPKWDGFSTCLVDVTPHPAEHSTG